MQIIVLGMHRSGTSALAGILNLMGCYFGSEDARVGPRPDNPKGFWERTDVMTVNNDILRVGNGNWWDVADINFDYISPEDLAWFHKRIGNIILKLDTCRPWFVKDPRMCLTLNFWLPLLECPVFVWVQRNALQVAKSLQKRNNMPLYYGINLWEFYTRSMLYSLNGRSYIEVSYESLLHDPYETTSKLRDSLIACGISSLHQPKRYELEAFLDPSLCHFGKDEEEDTRFTLSNDNFLTDLNKNRTNELWSIEMRTELLHKLRRLRNEGDWAIMLNNTKVYKGRAELAAENEALRLRLRSVSQSRLVRLAGLISRILRGGERGLEAELDRINRLLSSTNGGVAPQRQTNK